MEICVNFTMNCIINLNKTGGGGKSPMDIMYYI